MKHGFGVLIVCMVLYCPHANVAAPSPPKEPTTLGDLKVAKRFGIGLSAAGPLSVFGIEADVNIDEQVSVSGGIGTGLDYSTFTVRVKHYLPGAWVSPYGAMGIARWWTSGTKELRLSPSVLGNRFLEPGHNYSDGFDVWILYPAVGVQFMHASGVAFTAEIQYLFKLFNFRSGTYAGLGVHWYF